jgi:protein-tyrosine-phosphatase
MVAGAAAGPARYPGAAAARHHSLPLPRLRPRHISDVRHQGDLVVTVCDLAHEELAEATAVHWSIPDPVPAGATRWADPSSATYPTSKLPGTRAGADAAVTALQAALGQASEATGR